MPPSQLYDSQSRPINLGKQLGSGGEGAVFETAGAPTVVAKVYHKVKTERAEKLRAMVGMASADIQKVAAWPLDTLHERPGGPAVGLVMKKVSHWREIHFLYSFATRRIHYPSADWRFLVGVARNLAAAFDELHKAAVVVGDVNQSNILVSEQAGVFFIDCDSFQIRQAGTTYRCEVGIDLFTPPELQGASFPRVDRTPDHDRFGLAVLIFHLLFMGRHPFSGRYLAAGDMPIDKAIREYRFAYGPGAQAYQMAPPPKTLTLDALPASTANLFVRAFTRGGGGRPTAGEWVDALQAMNSSAQHCSAHWGHYYAASVQGCPWCRLTQQGAPDYFLTVVRLQPGQAGPSFVLATVWATIEQMPRPQFRYARPAIPTPAPRPWPSHLPSAIPTKPGRPAVLSQVPARPPSRIAEPTIQRVKTSPNQQQRWAGGAALVCGAGAMFFLFFAVLLLVAGSFANRGGGTSRAVPVAFAILGVLAGVPAILSGVWWLTQESARRNQEATANAEYHEAWNTYRRALHAERTEWERRADEEVERAQKWYDQRVSEWHQAVRPIRVEAEQRKQVARQAEAAFHDAERQWQTAAERVTRSFDEAKALLEKMRSAYQSLNGEYQAEKLKLQAGAKEFQLSQFLDQHLIENAEIDKIGPGRKSVLASFGIETALHVQQKAIEGIIPGFGPVLTANLVNWRHSVEQTFVFNPGQGVPPHVVQALEQKYRSLKDPLENALRGGSQQLQGIVSRGNTELQTLRVQVEQRALQLGQAQADLRVIPKVDKT